MFWCWKTKRAGQKGLQELKQEKIQSVWALNDKLQKVNTMSLHGTKENPIELDSILGA